MESMGLIFLTKDVYLMRSEVQVFVGHLFQRIIVISVYNNQLKTSVHPVTSVITRLGRNLLYREQFSIFCSSCISYALQKKGAE